MIYASAATQLLNLISLRERIPDELLRSVIPGRDIAIWDSVVLPAFGYHIEGVSLTWVTDQCLVTESLTK